MNLTHKIYYGNSQADTATIGFKDKQLYEELQLSKNKRKIPTEQIMQPEAFAVLQEWSEKQQQ
ncbi:MAG: hypothetical protein ACFBSE_19535 [Prochloraceae cyanobacterium]